MSILKKKLEKSINRKETMLEKILKPVRINPVLLGVSLAGFGLSYSLLDSDNAIGQLTSFFTGGLGAFSFADYVKGAGHYFEDRKILKEHGFKKQHGEFRMKHYCDRQAFYVASVENGFRNEVSEFIEHTPREKKKFWYIPHI